jgi:tRNA pseudouridine55 synthase
VRIDALELLEIPDRGSAVFSARCGKGTYVRALARDIGQALGCLGHLIELRRTSVGAFNAAQAVTVAALQAAADAGETALVSLLLPVEAALTDLVLLNVSHSDAARLLSGQAILLRGRDAPNRSGATYAVCKGNLIAVGLVERGELRPLRVFNLAERS